jgi:hypothetical protein
MTAIQIAKKIDRTATIKDVPMFGPTITCANTQKAGRVAKKLADEGYDVLYSARISGYMVCVKDAEA